MKSSSPSNHSDTSVGSLRFESDKRQIGGILMIAGFCAIFEPLAGIATAIGPNGTTASSGIPLSEFFGGLCLIKIGLLAVYIGYNQAVHDWGNKNLTAYLMIFSLTAAIPFITNVVSIGRTTGDAEEFIPPAYAPSQSDFNFVGAMGILGVLSYSFAFVGAIFSMLFSLYTFQTNNPQDHNATYYRVHMGVYCTVLFIAGLSQLMLGAYIISNFGGGDMMEKGGPIAVSMYVVSFPEISVCVGLIQLLNAMWGLARSMGFGVFGDNDFSFQRSIYFGWFVQFVLQIVTQIGYLPGGALSHALATLTAYSFGLNLMPAYLDYKTRTIPEKIEAEYYTIPGTPTIDDVKENATIDDVKESAVQDVKEESPVDSKDTSIEHLDV